MANAAGTELGHHELATARLSIVGVRHNIPPQDRGERLELSIGLALETPLDRALVDVVEAGKRLCIRDISQGKQWLPTRLVDDPRGREGKDVIATLTPRERQITLLVCDGLPNKQLAQQLELTEGTVKIHLHNIYQKLNVPNRTALTMLAFAHREWLSFDPAPQIATMASRRPLLGRVA